MQRSKRPHFEGEKSEPDRKRKKPELQETRKEQINFVGILRSMCIGDSVDMSRLEGVSDDIPFASQYDGSGCLFEFPTDVLLLIFNFLSNFECWQLACTCKRLLHFRCNFVPLREENGNSKTTIQMPGFMEDISLSLLKPPWQAPQYSIINPQTLIRNQLSQFLLRGERNTPDPYRSYISELFQQETAEQPKSLSLPLFPHQKQALAWMLIVESVVAQKISISYSSLLRIPTSPNYAYLVCEDKIVPVTENSHRERKYQNKISTQGGFFADAHGLGKTISLISLIISNPRKLRDNGTYEPCTCPMVAQFETRATLVVCPDNLVAQWTNEITENSSLVCYPCITEQQYKDLSYSQIIEADVIVLSIDFISTNPTYTRNGKTTNRKFQLRDKQPIFHLFGWHRIIWDEPHLVWLNNFETKITWKLFISNFRWISTGTTGYSWFSERLNCKRDRKMGSQMLSLRTFYRTLFWRNTKASIGADAKIPAAREEIEIVKLLPVEMAIYKELGVDKLRDTYLLRTRFLTGTDIDQSHRNLNEPNKFLQNSIFSHKGKLENYRDILRNSKTEGSKLRNREAIVTSIQSLECYYMLHIDNVKYPCDLCDNECTLRTKLTCNDFICTACLPKIINSQKCEKCGECVDFAGLKPCEDDFPEFKISHDGVDPLRLRYGSRTAAIMNFVLDTLKANDLAKIIILSGIETYFTQLQSKLSECEPMVVTNGTMEIYSGSSARKNNLISTFNNGTKSLRILMLPLDHTYPYGVDWKGVTNVLFLDLSSANKSHDEYARGIIQRLGENVEGVITRFVVLNTLDQQNYESVYNTKIISGGLGPKSARN